MRAPGPACVQSCANVAMVRGVSVGHAWQCCDTKLAAQRRHKCRGLQRCHKPARGGQPEWTIRAHAASKLSTLAATAHEAAAPGAKFHIAHGVALTHRLCAHMTAKTT